MVIVGVAQIPLTYTWSAIWLDEMLTPVKAIGVLCILLVLALTIYTTLKKRKKEKEEEDCKKILDGESLNFQSIKGGPPKETGELFSAQ